ncbi:MAG TPA: AmmeMemoRadiSam system radical SAM enzyme [Armatimonadota bacterium]|jgi:pyruvate formate lyase activating enzyme
MKTEGWRHYQPKTNKPGPIAAVLAEPLEAQRVRCNLCAFRCVISPGHVGVCNVRHNVAGTLYALNYRKATALQVDPIEKKPFHHFHPGISVLGVAAPGCNYRCRFCQNFEISQMPVEYDRIDGRPLEPEWIVDRAVELGCKGIAFTYTEPTIYMEYAMEIGVLAKERGLLNVWVTNGYMTEEAIDLIAPWVDAANIDLKGFNDRFYLKICGARHKPVCDAIRMMHERGIWVEVSTVVIPGYNDSDDDMRAIAGFIRGVSPDIPWHVNAFQPEYRMADVPPTPPASIRHIRAIGLEEGLRYVYAGNIAGDDGNTTFCPNCRAAVIQRSGYTLTGWRLNEGACAACGRPIAGVGLESAPAAIDARPDGSAPSERAFCG